MYLCPRTKYTDSNPTAMQHPACGMVTPRVSRGGDLLILERQHDDNLDLQSNQAQAIQACKAKMC